MNAYDVVAKHCREQGRSIAEVERAAGLGGGTIRKWNGRYPRVSSIEAAAQALNISAQQLLEELFESEE